MRRCKQRGFSLAEVLVVLAIFLVLVAIAIPNVFRSIRRFQLESSARSVANALLRARYEAIRRNQLVTTVYREAPAPPVYGISTDGNLTLDADDPLIYLSTNVRMTQTGSPALTTMGTSYDCAPNCPPEPSGSPYRITFSSRGTCMQQVTSGTDSYWIESGRVYVLFVNHQLTGEWAAVTLTPAGRIRVWRWVGTAWTPA